MAKHRVFSAAEFQKSVLNGYQAEINSLLRISNFDYFKTLVESFDDYPSMIQGLEPSSFSDRLSIADTNESLQKAFNIVQLASSMYLFQNEEIRLADINSQQLTKFAEHSIKTAMAGNQKNLGKLAHRLHNTDAVRTIQLLKLLGLLKTHPATTTQLSLGSGHGSRDLASIHQQPGGESTTSELTNSSASLRFLSHTPQPQDVILVDNDPGYVDYFKNINETNSGRILAINEDTDVALEQIARKQEQKALAPRSLVVAFRIDHRMLPDVPEFFHAIAKVISGQADFILSIGAGHDESEFLGRTNKVQEVRNFLSDRGHIPVHICLHRGKSLAEQRQSPAFGDISFATHELLYCKLDREHLSKTAHE